MGKLIVTLVLIGIAVIYWRAMSARSRQKLKKIEDASRAATRAQIGEGDVDRRPDA